MVETVHAAQWKIAFVYFGDFSLRMCSFDHITTSGLKSDITFDFCAPVFLYKDAVISGAWHHFRRLL